MQNAAARVAEVARIMVEERAPILLLVGPGGNGGDALYAGAELAKTHRVDAFLVSSRAHEGALERFTAAGGKVVHELPLPMNYQLVIDGIAGLGAGRALPDEIAELAADAHSMRLPVLAIDIPSGIDPDSGKVPDPVVVAARGFEEEDKQWATQRVPAHINATVTVTFGCYGIAHAIAAEHCGQVVVADIGIGDRRLKDQLPPSTNTTYIRLENDADEGYDFSTFHKESSWMNIDVAGEPAPKDHKYSGGVVTICAGNETFQGAGELCALAAVKATSFGVRFAGNSAAMNHLPPEILRVKDLVHNYSSHAYTVGPGRGKNEWAATELRSILESPDPVVMDADALTLLGNDEDIKRLVQTREGLTVLTPHEGEFGRLSDISLEDRLEATRAMAREMNCFVLLKGRVTIVADPDGPVTVVEAGSSWAATPGSGDVLSGIMGAYVACVQRVTQDVKDFNPNVEDLEGIAKSYFKNRIVTAVVVHAKAALLGARTEFGYAPVSASGIVDAIPAATAYLRKD